MKTLVCILCVALTWSPICGVARAQPQSQEEGARAAARFQQGVELYREGNFEGALAEFRKAYQISPSYRVLYNIAQAQYALHDFVASQKSLMQYVAEGKGDLGPERRAQVDEMSRKLEERIGYLRISTNVTGAEVRVDDVSVGTSPLPGSIPVNVGTRRVSAFKAGAPTAVRVVAVAGKERVGVELHIDEPMVAPRRVAPEVAPQSTSLVAKAAPVAAAPPSRAALMVSLSTTAALAVGTGVFGYLALSAQKDSRDQVNAFPNTRAKIEDARSRSKTYGYVTDALGAATLISGGVALYLALSQSGASGKPMSQRNQKSTVLVPTAGGVALLGSF